MNVLVKAVLMSGLSMAGVAQAEGYHWRQATSSTRVERYESRETTKRESRSESTTLGVSVGGGDTVREVITRTVVVNPPVVPVVESPRVVVPQVVYPTPVVLDSPQPTPPIPPAILPVPAVSSGDMSEAILGGIAGALIGAQVGKGNGKAAAAAIGAAAGAMVGDRLKAPGR